MPEIRQYTRQRLPQQMTGSRRATAADFGGDQTGLMAQAGGFEALAGATKELSVKVQEIKERRDRSDYMRKLSEFQLENMQREKELLEQDYEDVADFAQTWARDLQERAQAYMGDVPNHLQEQWASDLSRMTTSFAQSGMQEQVRREGVKQKLNFENTLDNWNNIVSQNPSRIGEAKEAIERLASSFNLPEVDRDVLLDKAFDKFKSTQSAAIKAARTSAFEADPLAYYKDSQENPENYTADERKKIRDLADGYEKQVEKDNNLAAITSDIDGFNRVMDAENPMTLAEIEKKIDVEGETPFNKWAYNKISGRVKDVERTVTEKAKVFADLQKERTNLKARFYDDDEYVFSGEAHKAFKEFQDKVYKAANDGFITEQAKILNLTQEYNEDFFNAMAGNKGEAFGNKWARGVQDPYQKGFNKIDSYLERVGLENDAIEKERLFLEFQKNLGDYKSSGNHADDMEKINQAWKNTVINLNLAKNPNLPDQTNAVIPEYRDVVMEDAKGNKARVRVYNDGRKEVLGPVDD